MKIALREDLSPDIDFYYHQQFKIYHKPYLIWDWDTWRMTINTCSVYHMEVDEKWVGDVILENRKKNTTYIVDFSILPEYQGKGIGKAVLEQVKKMGKDLTGITRGETLDFFLKSGFVLKRTLRNYYQAGADGYYITFSGKTVTILSHEKSEGGVPSFS